MIGLEVAPVAPAARFDRTRSGSIESSQSFVPVASRDSIGLGMDLVLPWGVLRRLAYPILADFPSKSNRGDAARSPMPFK